jgi:hypothetical protein
MDRAMEKLTTETPRHREEREKNFSALFSAALCVLCGN